VPRFLDMAAIALVFAGLAAAAPAPMTPTPAKKGPSAEQIQQAVENLGSPRFAVRETASRFLWEAGAAAEDAIRAATKSKDEETANRANTIFEKFNWGLYPDTPAEVAKLIDRFRNGDAAARVEVVGELIRMKPVRFSTIRKLIAQEHDENARLVMYESMAIQARQTVPVLIVANQLDQANELLEVCIDPSNPESMSNYAAFQYLRKKVPEAIQHMEAMQKKGAAEDARRASEALVYLHRIQRDWPAARKAAIDAKNKDLENDVAWEANDWKSLSEAKELPESRVTDYRGEQAAYFRLAGNKARSDEIIADLRKDLNGVEGNDKTALVLANALLLNGRGAEAIAVLKERPKGQPDLVFDVLCAQLKFKEAFALADRAAEELAMDETGAEAHDALDLQRGKVLAALGDRDAATQVFRGLIDRLLKGSAVERAKEAVWAIARAGLRDLAAECAGRCIARYDSEGVGGTTSALLDPFLNEQRFAAQVWWYAYRKESPTEEPAVTMGRILKIIDGKADAKMLDQLAMLIGKLNQPAGEPGPKDPVGNYQPQFGNSMSAFAIAEAYRLNAGKDKAEEFYKKAVEAKDEPKNRQFLAPPEDLLDEDASISVPGKYRFLMAYADFLLTQKHPKEAAVHYRKAWDLAPAQPLPLFMHGYALGEAGNKAEGSRLMELAHWVTLGDEAARSRFSDDLSRRTFDADSRREMDLIVATAWFRSYYVGNVFLRLARIKARQKDFATAALYYEKDVVSLFRTPTRFVEPRAYLTVPEVSRMYRAKAMLAAGKIDEAMAEVRLGLEALPGNVDMAIGFVPDLDKAGKKKEAEEIYGKVKAAFAGALKDYGASPDLRNSLAWTMVNCNRDLDEAMKHAEKAVEQAPQYAGYIDTLAEVHFRKKDRTKALELMKQCVKLEPGNPYYRKQLERFEKKPFDSPLPDEETGDDD
jgi:tetratricopeptide (TPR) repeat protein